jgi:hypothetical protein
MKLETPPTDSENNFFSLSGKRKAGFLFFYFFITSQPKRCNNDSIFGRKRQSSWIVEVLWDVLSEDLFQATVLCILYINIGSGYYSLK